MAIPRTVIRFLGVAALLSVSSNAAGLSLLASLDGDDDVDLDDFGVFVGEFNLGTVPPAKGLADFDSDGDIDGDDFGIFVGEYLLANRSATPSPGVLDEFSCFDTDGDIDGDDFGVFVGNYNLSAAGELSGEDLCGDFDSDRDVDFDDFGVFVEFFNGFNRPQGAVATPEPGAAVLIGLGICLALSVQRDGLTRGG